MKPIAEFLSRHPPFEGVGDAELERIATDVEVEYYAPNEVVFRQAEEPMRHVRVVRTGAVELVEGEGSGLSPPSEESRSRPRS